VVGLNGSVVRHQGQVGGDATCGCCGSPVVVNDGELFDLACELEVGPACSRGTKGCLLKDVGVLQPFPGVLLEVVPELRAVDGDIHVIGHVHLIEVGGVKIAHNNIALVRLGKGHKVVHGFAGGDAGFAGGVGPQGGASRRQNKEKKCSDGFFHGVNLTWSW